jgi:hypothetical protein
MDFLATEEKQAKRSVSLKFIIVITHFRVTRATNSRTLTRCMNVRYVVGKEQETAFCFGVSCIFCEYFTILEVDM